MPSLKNLIHLVFFITFPLIVGLLAIPTKAIHKETNTKATIADYTDIVTPLDQGFNQFSGNSGLINDQYLEQTLHCPTNDINDCRLRLNWDFGDDSEGFTGIFQSIFGLTETKATFDGQIVELVAFPEHYLDLDRIDGMLKEPNGNRAIDDLCFEILYDGNQELQLRVELKDVEGGVRFRRFSVGNSAVTQTHCWNFRDDFSRPAGTPDLDIHRAKELVFVIENANVADGIDNPEIGTIDFYNIWFTLNQSEVEPPDDQEALDLEARRAYQYFHDWTSRKPASRDLPQDRSTFADLLTAGGVGFALPAHIVAIDQGWITRQEAAEKVVNVLRVLDDEEAFGAERIGRIGYKGWFYHFWGIDGRRKLNFDFEETPINESLNTVELSTIDTSLALMGVLAVQSFFDDPYNFIETEIRNRAQSIYDRVDWNFMLEKESQQFYLGWKPNEDYEGPEFEIPDKDDLGSYSGIVGDPATLDYYTDEGLMTILLSLGSTTHPVSLTTYYSQIFHEDDGLIQTYPGSLFTYQFLGAFMDTRTIKSNCLSIDWYENSREAIKRTLAYAIDNPKGYPTYSSTAWGISAAENAFDYYHAFGAPPVAVNPDPEEDGTVTYYAMLSAASFGDDLHQLSVEALRAGWDRNHWHPRFGLPDAFHDEISVITDEATPLRGSGPWVNHALFAIDQGPIVLHIANAKNQIIWAQLAKNPNIQRSLHRLAASAQLKKVSEAENGTGDGQIKQRSNAWEKETVLLNDGETRQIRVVPTDGVNALLSIRYSNDNYGPLETLTLNFDDLLIGSFIATDTGNYGNGWNIFTMSDPFMIDRVTEGEHEISVEVAGGDGYGVEIDAIKFDYCALVPESIFLPFINFNNPN
ncbi:MAG: glucoamylase family protein [Anaerolineales bacterium]